MMQEYTKEMFDRDIKDLVLWLNKLTLSDIYLLNILQNLKRLWET